MCINEHLCPHLTSCHLRTVIIFCYQSLLYVSSRDSNSVPHFVQQSHFSLCHLQPKSKFLTVFLSLKNYFFIYVFILYVKSMCACVCAHMCMYTVLRSWYLPFTMWFPGMYLRSSDSRASTFYTVSHLASFKELLLTLLSRQVEFTFKKCLFTPYISLKADQSNGPTQVQLSERMSSSALFTGGWMTSQELYLLKSPAYMMASPKLIRWNSTFS